MRSILQSLIIGMCSVFASTTGLAQHAPMSKVVLNHIDLSLTAIGTEHTVGVVVWDQRIQVIDGSQPPSFVGYRRSEVKIAFPLNTKTREAFSSVLTNKICSGYEANGTPCRKIATEPTDTWEAVMKKMADADCDRFLVLRLEDVLFDGYRDFWYKATLKKEVYDAALQPLVSVQVYENRHMSEGPGEWEERFDRTFKGLMEDVLNDAEIIAALGTSTNKATAPTDAGTVQKTVGSADIILTKAGDELAVIVSEITLDTVKYRLASQPEGPIRNIAKADVFMIKYKDGTKEIFNQ